MGDKTGIEWTDATWNPIVGCKAVSDGCDNCYAARMSSGRLSNIPEYQGLARDGRFTGEVRVIKDRFDQPLRWKRPRKIFVNSMSDLFHPDVPDDARREIFDIMAKADWHVFQVLTKRPQIMQHWVTEYYGGSRPLTNVWLGASIENDSYTFRADHLRATPAAIRFLSLEPLLGPVTGLDLQGIDWVIVGGESGPNARPMHPNWVREIRDTCMTAKVPFLFKQWGEHAPEAQVEVSASMSTGYLGYCGEWSGPHARIWGGGGPRPVVMAKVGKRKAGRLLDGEIWDQYPK